MTTAQNPLPLSVFIIARNESDRIGRAIASVRGWVSQIVVIDSGSTDNTIDIARAAGADLVEFNAWKGYGQQKSYAETRCTQRWVLSLDADEMVSNELRQTISALFEGGQISEQPVYRVDAIEIFPYENHPRTFAPHTLVARLYDKEQAGFRPSAVHDSVILKATGEIVANAPVLAGALYHYSFRNIAHIISKINNYSTMQADDWMARQKPIPWVRMVVEPFSAFLKAYFLRRYLFMGLMGFHYSLIYAFSRSIRMAKIYERYRRHSD